MNETKDPGESTDIREELHKVLLNPDDWLNSPNEIFGGEKPGDLLNTNKEFLIWEFARRAKHGSIS